MQVCQQTSGEGTQCTLQYDHQRASAVLVHRMPGRISDVALQMVVSFEPLFESSTGLDCICRTFFK